MKRLSLFLAFLTGIQAQTVTPPSGGGGGGGSGTVTTTGTMTADAVVTSNGTTVIKTPSATTTVDASGNLSTPGSGSFGVGSASAGAIGLTQGTAASTGTTNVTLYAPTSVTSYTWRLPGAAATGFYLGTNTAGDVVTTQVAANGIGNVVLTTSPTLVTPDIGVATATSINATPIPSTQTLATLAVTQTFSGDKAFTGLLNAGSASRTAPFKVGTIAALPGTCTVGDMYFANNATAGQNAYFCTASNTWTQQLNSGAGGTGCVTSGSAGQFLVDDGANGCTSLSILTRSTNTIAGGAALTFDLSASTAIKVPGSFTTGLLHNTTSTGAVVGGLLVNADVTDGTLAPAKMTNPARDFVFGVTFDGGGSALTSGTTVARYVTLPLACTIVGWSITADAGTATLKTWRLPSGSAIPTITDSISTSGVSLSMGTAVQSTTVTDWTDTTLDAGDVIGLNLSAVATATLVEFQITCRK